MGGTPATGADCDTPNTAKCVACESGYQLYNNNCASCSDEYYKDGDQCLKRECTCENGTPATGADCDAPNTAKCASCSDEYYKDGDQCLKRECACNNGDPATDADCTRHLERCVACESGYQLYNNNCASCSDEYYKDGDQCVKRECTCENGTPATDSDCTKNLERCVACESSHYLKDKKCKQNECTCENGTPFTDAFCYPNGKHLCERCDDDYYLAVASTEEELRNTPDRFWKCYALTQCSGSQRQLTPPAINRDRVCGIQVTYDTALDNTYELCNDDTSHKIVVNKQGSEHNVWEVGGSFIYADLNSYNITDTENQLAAAKGKAREFYCSAHRNSRFTVYCRGEDGACPDGYEEQGLKCVMSDNKLLQNICGGDDDYYAALLLSTVTC